LEEVRLFGEIKQPECLLAEPKRVQTVQSLPGEEE